MSTHSPERVELHEPVPSHRSILVLGIAGIAVSLAALILGLATGAPLQGFEAHWADGPRALLAALGLVVAGCGVSMNPRWYGGWLCGAACGFISYGFGGSPPPGTEWYLAPPRDWVAGVPNSWDSVQLFFGVAGGLGLVGALATRLPSRVVLTFAFLAVCYHYSAILSAVTSPPPTPWVTDQYWARIARPYVQFAYFNNAYQFYSPDPGPACQIWACIEYKSDSPDDERDCEWVYVGIRDQDYIDPLGMTYYRRLAVTENIAQYMPPSYQPLREEHEKVLARRMLAARDRVPRTFPEDNVEYRLPNQLVTRQVLPSFARHIIHMHGRPGREVKSVKIYRVLHLIITLNQFRGYDPNTGKKIPGMSPYDPSLLMPFFQGEYDPQGKLMDPTEEMLFWYVPIWRERELPLEGYNSAEYKKNGGFSRYYLDFVAKHAGCPRPQE